MLNGIDFARSRAICRPTCSMSLSCRVALLNDRKKISIYDIIKVKLIQADVAQWQSSCFVNSRPRVRLPSSAPF